MAGKPVFRRIGDFSVKHSRKIIVLWIIAFISMAPFAVVFFNNVDFNIGGSLVPNNSMTQRSSDLQTQYFGGNGTSGSSVVIVANNTSLKTQTGTSGLINLISDLNTTLKSNSSYNGITSIFSIEKQILKSSSEGIKILLNSSFLIVQTMNEQYYFLENQTNGSISFIYGTPAYYLSSFVQSGYNTSAAYNATIQLLLLENQSQLGIPYFNSVIQIWNGTFSANPTGNAVTMMNSSINDVLQSNTSLFYSLMKLYGELSFFVLLSQISQNYSLSQYISNTGSSQIFYDPSFVSSFTAGYLTDSIAGNSTIMEFVNSVYLTPGQLVQDSISIPEFPTTTQIRGVSESISASAFRNSVNGSPDLVVNNLTFSTYISTLDKSTDVNATVQYIMNGEALSFYPILPKAYVLHQFVGYNFKTSILIIGFSSNLSITTYNKIVDHVTNQSKQIDGSSFFFSSDLAQNLQTSSQFNKGLVTALVIGIALSIIIVGLFFRSPVAAFIPLIMFMFTAVISMGFNGIIDKYILRSTISFITPTLLLILLLGLTSDYMVYIMARYRREIQNGNRNAAQVATQWSGNAVFTSGFTVALSYVVLWISGIPIFSDSGLTNFVGVSITIVLANTLLIALLHRYGEKMFWPAKRSLHGSIPMEKGMTRVAKFTIENKKKILAIFAVVSIASFFLYMETPTGLQIFDLIPQSSAVQAVAVVNSSFHGDFFERGFVILHFNSSVASKSGGNTTYNLNDMRSVTKAEYAILNTSGISQVYGPTFPYGYYQSADLSNVSSSYMSEYKSQINSYIGNSSNYVILYFQTSELSWNQASFNTVNAMNNNLSAIDQANGFTYETGGLTQGLIDTNNYAYSTFMETLPLLVVAIFIVLLLQLFSVFTPIRLIAMVLLAVVISLSLSYILLFYIFSMPILVFMPIFTVITLLAVGLDYDIFLITRVREEIIKGASTRFAVRTTIKENGGVIIALGMLLFVTFIALHFTNIGIMDEIGTGLALGVLVDTFVSWPFFVPVIMLYMSKYNWWPSKVGRDVKDYNQH